MTYSDTSSTSEPSHALVTLTGALAQCVASAVTVPSADTLSTPPYADATENDATSSIDVPSAPRTDESEYVHSTP